MKSQELENNFFLRAPAESGRVSLRGKMAEDEVPAEADDWEWYNYEGADEADIPTIQVYDNAQDEWANITLKPLSVERPRGSEGLSYREMEVRVCDIILAGWVFLRSDLWNCLPFDVQWLIYRLLARRHLYLLSLEVYHFGTDPFICPSALVTYWLAFDLDYERKRHPSLIENFCLPDTGFTETPLIGEIVWGTLMRGRHDFSQFGQSVLAGRRMQDRHPDSLWAPFLGPNFVGTTQSPRRTGKNHVLARKHTASTPTARDRSNRSAYGRIVTVVATSQTQRKPRPKNVVWQKGRQTGQRHRGK